VVLSAGLMYSAKKTSIVSAPAAARILRRAVRNPLAVREPLPLARITSSRRALTSGCKASQNSVLLGP
jgi:hypothetical protein